MATVSITLTPCSHLNLTITHEGKTREITTTKDELKRLFTQEEGFDLALKNLIIYCRLSGITDWTQLKTQIEGKEFKI